MEGKHHIISSSGFVGDQRNIPAEGSAIDGFVEFQPDAWRSGSSVAGE
ncbi:hypothetical protein M3I54_40835 [Paraburkholderia sp. CNPSo 3274]|nr:hypothetical protein [Paraburkholderia sp. CNPSo 3274]MCP3713150.1 hypothetical protein [Paraburkholderia sp. CNPSo 3274]